MLKGIGASDGIAIGKVLVYEEPHVVIEKRQVDDIDKEVLAFDMAINRSVASIEKLRAETEKNVSSENVAIFSAHIEILKDPEFSGAIKSLIVNDHVNADFALDVISKQFISIFENMENEYLRERAADIKDVSKRLMHNILGIESIDLSEIQEEVVLVSKDLTPSETAQLNKEKVLGFITDVGGRTSHSAIMARTLEIPAVLGTVSSTMDLMNDDIVILDGIEGIILVNPDEAKINDYKKRIAQITELKKNRAMLIDKKTITLDGKHVELAANIGNLDDVEGVIKNGAEGIGLYRTEFLYMGQSDFPSEEVQYNAYRKVLESMKDKPVVIRTLDIGGDKHLDYMAMDEELNPFLGVRAIRLCLKRKDLFKVQLRALLRASKFGNLHIMFPMIASLKELQEVKAFLDEIKMELTSENIDLGEYKIGIMIEIPAAVLAAEHLAKEVDFFSIGTNDLIQYTFAADRMNENVSYLYQPFNPSLLKLIQMVTKAADDAGIWVGMCGEMASDERAVPILLGLGLKELSMSAPSILKIRDLISKIDIKSAEELANEVVQFSTDEDVMNRIDKYLEDLNG